MITCIIISYNEEKRIRLVIEAAKRWADEVVLADKSSTDGTPSIARQLGVYVHQLPYSEQGTENGQDVVAGARFDWVFCITAGEIPTPDLIVNIRRILRSKSDLLDLIVVPLKYWSFGTHHEKSPWGWSKQHRVFHRGRITYLNQVHNHITASPDRTIDLSHHRETAHILHQTHPNSRQFMRSHWEYMRAEAEADPHIRLANALGQINRYDGNFDHFSSKMQLHAWKLYWHGVALHCLEKIQDRNIESEYSWRREKYYKLWDASHLETEDQPEICVALKLNGYFSLNSPHNVDGQINERWIIDQPKIGDNGFDKSLESRCSKLDRASALTALFEDPYSLDVCKSLFLFNSENCCFTESIVWVKRILKIEPQNINWINKLIIEYSKNGQLSESIIVAEESLRQNGSVYVIEKNLLVLKNRLANSSAKLSLPPPVLSCKKPKVSAIVSVYNASKYLEQCLNNLFSQSLYIAGELEVVVVNTGSQQDEGLIVRRFINDGYNIKYIEVATRETVYSAWNRGIQAADGIYVTSANADDRHHNTALQIMVEALEKNSDIALVYADVDITEEENKIFGDALIVGRYKWSDFCPIKLLGGCFCGPQPMWRKEIHEQIGYFDADFVSAGDYEMWLRMAVNYKFLHLKEVLGLYLKSILSVEHSNMEIGIKEANIARSRYQDNILKKHRQQVF